MKINLQEMASEILSDKVTRQRLAGEKLEFIRYRYQAGAVFARHQHEAEQLTIVLRGKLVFTFDDEEVSLTAGDALLIASNRPHGAFVPKDAEETLSYNLFSPARQHLPQA